MSLFKKKDTSFEDMDSREQLKRINEQLGFLEKKIDSVLEQLGNRGGRPSFGGDKNRNFGQQGSGRDRGYRGGQNRGGQQRTDGGNTRYAGQGPRRYSSSRPFGNDENRGNFGGANRPEGRHNSNRHSGGPRRPHQGQGQGQGQINQNPGLTAPPDLPAAEESMPE